MKLSKLIAVLVVFLFVCATPVMAQAPSSTTLAGGAIGAGLGAALTIIGAGYGSAGQRRLGAPLEIVGGDGPHERHVEMGMRIDAARHHIAAPGVDDLGAGGRVEGGAGRGDGLAVGPGGGGP